MFRYTKKSSNVRSTSSAATRSSAQSSQYDSDASKCSPSNIRSQQSTKSALKGSSSPFKSVYLKSTDAKTLIAKLTGVGHLIIPKDIKFQKWLISTFLITLFMFTAILNGIIIYGIESVINDKCYSPFIKIVKPQNSGPYRCPSIPDGFISPSYAWLIRMFEVGSTLHAISIGIASSAIYYLNFGLLSVYIILFLVSLTIMLVTILLETMIFKVGLLAYFSLSNVYVIGFLIYFVIDVIHMFAAINLQVRWISFLV